MVVMTIATMPATAITSAITRIMFDFEVAKTVYDRFETLHRPNGMVGYAYTALRQAFYGADSDRLLLVTFETLTKSPLVALNAIYSFLDLPRFEHDFERIGFDDPQVAEFDKFLGTPGLHQVDGYAHPYSYQSDAGAMPQVAGLDDHYADWDADKDQDAQDIRQILSDMAAQAGY